MPKPEPDKVQIGPDDAAHPPKKNRTFFFSPFFASFFPCSALTPNPAMESTCKSAVL